MKHGIRFLTIMFAMFLLVGTFTVSASAQTGRRTAVRKPGKVRYIIVRDPFWRYRYYGDPFWGYSYYRSPYQRYAEQRYRLQEELRGNLSELEKHRAKYSADGRLSQKEREELADDERDVARARRELNAFNRAYGRY